MMPEQFPYPEKGWSTGRMRMAKSGMMTRGSTESGMYRELEGVRKERSQRLSQFGGVEGSFADNPVLETMESLAEGRKKAQNIPGLITPGNIDLGKRPQVPHEGGTATVRSISIEQDGKHILIPTVIGNKVVSDDEAKAHFQKTGEHLGIFESGQDADSYGRALSKEQGKYYGVT